MERMKSNVPLDSAVFQLSPKRSRCELFVSSGGSTEKIASGLFKPFVTHLKFAEEQITSPAPSIKLAVGPYKNAETWFTKGTLERFVQFVSKPEVLEQVNSSDAEMSQLEAARRIYSQGAGVQLSGGGGSGATAADDATKKELLKAIDVRLAAVQQDLSTASDHAAAAGFNVDTVSELLMFADKFGAHRLSEACGKFISFCERRPNLISQWKTGSQDRAVRSSYESDMSIDDDQPPPPPPKSQEPVKYQQSNPPATTNPFRRTVSMEPSVERSDRDKQNDAVGEKDLKDETTTRDQAEPEPIQASQPARRLSVQDRINMFENKQKESSGGKPSVGKSVELRRLSSDLSTMGAAAAEKAVLRRWSGASDMSIDLSAEKPVSESTSFISSPTVPLENKLLNSNSDATKSSIIKPDIKIIPSLSKGGEVKVKEDSSKSGRFLESIDGLADPLSNKTTLASSIRGNLDNPGNKLLPTHKDDSKEKFKVMLHVTENSNVFGDQEQLKGFLSEDDFVSQLPSPRNMDHGSPVPQLKTVGSKGSVLDTISNKKEYPDSVKHTNLKSTRKTVGELRMIERVSGSKFEESSTAPCKGVGSDSSSAQLEVRYVEKKESQIVDKASSGSVSGVEDSGPQNMKFRQISKAEMSKKAKVQPSGFRVNNKDLFSGEVTAEDLRGFNTSSTQFLNQPKGNQEPNNELKMKANELEKLFAEHKQRVSGDQSSSADKGNSEDTQRMQVSSLHPSKQVVADNTPLLSVNRKSSDPTESSKNKNKPNTVSVGESLDKNFSELSVSEGSRGKFYNKYTQKRDAKLREDWSSNRAEKEARLKSLQDSLSRSKSEMKAKFSGSADRQDSISSVRWRAERLRSYNSRSTMGRAQLTLDFEDDAEEMDFPEKNYHEDRNFEDISSVHGKKFISHKRNLSSSTPRASAAPVLKSATKTSTISGKQRMQPENPLAQSVPNFSDLRKENTKPSHGGSKTTHSQVRNNIRSKSSAEEATIVKEDKSRRLQAFRKTSANLRDFREVSHLDADGVDSTGIKFDDEVPKRAGTKPFLRKGSRAAFVSQTSVSRQRASVGSDPPNNVDENADMADKDVDEEFEALEHGEQIIRLESENMENSESENDDGTPTFSRVDQALGSQLPSKIPSSFLPVDSVEEWPTERSLSWNPHSQHPFSYPQEMSDVDASVDSPVGSPTSWNSQSLNHMESDSARMRKKWGMAQKPVLVAHSSQNLARKDMTKGFKRLLKFGRKNRGSESLADWISATTSEGDDDVDDGRDPANRSSDDLRKSRMGFSHAQPVDDSFNENEFFNESVQFSESSIPAPPTNFRLREDHISGSSIKGPRSFFSLSTFRSKGSEAKPR